jgi:secreted PhoX family phosphatase
MRATRRELFAAGAGGVAVVGLGGAFWSDLFRSAAAPRRTPGFGYGPRRPPNEHGVRLPEGFRSRVIARGGDVVPGTSYRWHVASDGSATFPVEGGGFILVSNSETLDGGASAIRFSGAGDIEAAYRILSGTTQNCSGGGTPWGTWLSCEETEDGLVWECDPAGRRRARSLPAMGVFKHEAAAVDPRGRRVYLTEDLIDGCFYRYTPHRWPDLRAGRLEIAVAGSDDQIGWRRVPDPTARRRPLRRQVPDSLILKRGEGIWHDDGTVYVATTGDSRVHAYDIAGRRIRVVYDGLGSRTAPLLRVDQITVSRAGEVFICEDLATEEIDIGVMDRRGRVSRFLSVTGREHQGSELTGVTFDPSGGRMFFSSQRAGGDGAVPGPGAIYEVSGPFRR